MSSSPPPPPPPVSGSQSNPLSTPKVDSSFPKMAMTQDSPDLEENFRMNDYFTQKAAAARCLYVKNRIEQNKLKLEDTCKHLLKLAQERENNVGDANSINLLRKRGIEAINTLNGMDINNENQDNYSPEEDSHSSAIFLGSRIVVKNTAHPIMLNKVKREAPCPPRVVLDRNQ